MSAAQPDEETVAGQIERTATAAGSAAGDVVFVLNIDFTVSEITTQLADYMSGCGKAVRLSLDLPALRTPQASPHLPLPGTARMRSSFSS